MHLDPNGSLASMLSQLLSEPHPTVPLTAARPVDGFEAILNQLTAVLEEHGAGQLPMDNDKWDQLWSDIGLSLNSEAGGTVKNLPEFTAHLEALLRQVHDNPPMEERQQAGIDLTSGVMPFTATLSVPAIHIEEEGKETLIDAFSEEGKGTIAASESVLAAPSSSFLSSGNEKETGVPIVPQAHYGSYPNRETEAESAEQAGTKGGEAIGEDHREIPSIGSKGPSLPQPSQFDDRIQALPEKERDHATEMGRFHTITEEAGSLRGERTLARQTLALNHPYHHPEWGDELGERLLWMQGKSVQMAELRINPQHLGPIEVRIHIQDDQTQIQFASHHVGVREAIESALPRLRELFGAQQLQLSHVDVTHQSFSEQQSSQGRREPSRDQMNDYGVTDWIEEGVTDEGKRLSPPLNRLLSLYV